MIDNINECKFNEKIVFSHSDEIGIEGCWVSIDLFAKFECGVGNGRDFFFRTDKRYDIYTSILLYTNTEYIMVICLLFCLPFGINLAFDFNYKSVNTVHS